MSTVSPPSRLAPGLTTFVIRPGKKWVPVIAADQLPPEVELFGVPREVDLHYLDPDQLRTINWIDPEKIGGTMFKLASPPKAAAGPGPAQPRIMTASTGFMAPDAKVRGLLPNSISQGGETLNSNVSVTTPSVHTRSTPTEGTRPLPHPDTSSPTPNQPPRPSKSLTDSIASLFPRDGARLKYIPPSRFPSVTNSAPPSGVIPDPKRKEYCTYWIQTGDCAYMSQGCMYKHEMPDLKKLREIGFHQIPKWWKEKCAVRLMPVGSLGGIRGGVGGLGGITWLERREMERREMERREMERREMERREMERREMERRRGDEGKRGILGGEERKEVVETPVRRSLETLKIIEDGDEKGEHEERLSSPVFPPLNRLGDQRKQKALEQQPQQVTGSLADLIDLDFRPATRSSGSNGMDSDEESDISDAEVEEKKRSSPLQSPLTTAPSTPIKAQLPTTRSEPDSPASSTNTTMLCEALLAPPPPPPPSSSASEYNDSESGMEEQAQKNTERPLSPSELSKNLSELKADAAKRVKVGRATHAAVNVKAKTTARKIHVSYRKPTPTVTPLSRALEKPAHSKALIAAKEEPTKATGTGQLKTRATRSLTPKEKRVEKMDGLQSSRFAANTSKERENEKGKSTGTLHTRQKRVPPSASVLDSEIAKLKRERTDQRGVKEKEKDVVLGLRRGVREGKEAPAVRPM
ncbi:hypothetical protein GQ43DRAFT_435709 [Delitschia confertaspora ATCC 74209]|uniref:C3H1-type domain-containing protein n=1 Tax=Delitschia confertaspora ATCC 74209 TaxID=1513339 RepID=A0A9P4JHH4_9PLEO|nr:hypothetical protein GQ43DRAFT_435709 [Delitschia confertaspora ATCC 74209]